MNYEYDSSDQSDMIKNDLGPMTPDRNVQTQDATIPRTQEFSFAVGGSKKMVVTESEDRNDTLKNVDLEKAVDELKSQFIESGADEYEEMLEEPVDDGDECEEMKDDTTKANDPKQQQITNFFSFGSLKKDSLGMHNEGTIWKNVAEALKKTNSSDDDVGQTQKMKDAEAHKKDGGDEESGRTSAKK